MKKITNKTSEYRTRAKVAQSGCASKKTEYNKVSRKKFTLDSKGFFVWEEEINKI